MRQPNVLSVATAKKLLTRLRIQKPDEIDVELIAAEQGVLVQSRPLSHEEGRLVRAGANGIITVAEDAFRTRKWRFVIAHELGHFLRHPDVDQFALCTDTDLRKWYQGSGREAEANDFAAELLMPEALFAKKCDRNRPSLRDVRELAEEFNTSLTSTAIRFVHFAPEPCAVVLSKGGVVEWWDWSKDFRLVIRKGGPLTTRTYAGDIFAGKPVADRPQQVDGDAWSSDTKASDIDLFEHSVQVARDLVLSFLWHPY